MRYIKIILISFCFLLLQGCSFNNPKYINFSSKPNDYYYSNLIYEKVKNNESFSLKVFDKDMYKYYNVDPTDNDILLTFFESLNTDNYVKDTDIPEKYKYELIIEFADSKYIINAYSKDLITVYPWDGNYKEDIINTSTVSEYNNIYSYCTYIINKSHSR